MTEKIQISVSSEFKKDLDNYIKNLDVSRSKFLMIAAYKYLKELRKKEIRKQLIEGYSAKMSDKIVRLGKRLQAKTLKKI